jgi:xanthine dehydrogenase accessory factor
MDSVDLEVLKSAVSWLHQGQRVNLVTVVKTWGSAPRPLGALLAISGEARLVGSVSGGCVEDDLLTRVLSDEADQHLPYSVTYGVNSEDARRFGLPCGGTLSLVIEPVSDVTSLETVLAQIERRELVARTLNMRTGKAMTYPATREQKLLFDEVTLTSVYGPRWRLLIIGAGQLSRYLAEMAMALDYHVLICDPREEYRNSWNVSGSAWVEGMPDEVVNELNLESRSAVIALTHDPKLDDMALLEALKSDAFYVGALGSKANQEKRRQRLASFDLTEKELARLRGPVGLPIGSRTPPEIALAILAELTALRNGITLSATAQHDQTDTVKHE